MSDLKLPPAITGTDMRLDALIQRVDRLCDLLRPKQTPPPKDGATVELREPIARPAAKPADKAKRS